MPGNLADVEIAESKNDECQRMKVGAYGTRVQDSIITKSD